MKGQADRLYGGVDTRFLEAIVWGTDGEIDYLMAELNGLGEANIV